MQLALNIMAQSMPLEVIVMENKLPPVLEHWLNQVGIRKPLPKQNPIERDFSFKTPIFDENGEPNF